MKVFRIGNFFPFTFRIFPLVSKFEVRIPLINGFFGFTTTDWTWATGKVSKGRMPFYARELQSELQRRADEGDPVYDEDGSYMQLPDAYRVDYSNVVLKP